MKISAVRLQSLAQPEPSRPSAPSAEAAGKPTTAAKPTTGELLSKLQTAEGQQLLSELVQQLEPHATATPHAVMEPGLGPKNIADRFEQALVTGLFERFTRERDVRDHTVGVLADELHQLADRSGAIDAQRVQKALGPKGLQFFERLASITATSGDPLADRRSFNPLSTSTAAAIARQQPIAPKMSALDTMVSQLAKKGEFKDFAFMGLQHLFASSVTMFDAIHSLGVKHEDMRFVGKVYSTNHRVVAELQSKGATVDNVSMRVGLQAFDKAMESGIEWQLRQIIDTLPQPDIATAEGRRFSEKPTPRVLLIDDGAEAIKVLHEKFPEHAPFFVCVEQTRRGARILHELQQKGELKCAVANVAETWAKLEWESPMIGHSVVLEVDRKLDRLEKAGVPAARESLVLGCGAVGGGVARAMVRRGMDVHLYDKDPTRAIDLKAAMVKDGLDAAKIVVHDNKQSALGHGNVVVSCVGMRTIEREDHAHLPNGAILVNAASADDELGPQDLLPYRKMDTAEFDARGNMWNTFRGEAVNTGKADAEAHSDAVVKTPDGKEFLVVNNGYVVNMTGERDPIPPRYIQLTRTLLFLGALTAKRAAEAGVGNGDGVGLHDVPAAWQEALVHLVQRDLKKSGEDLKKPSWDQSGLDAHAEEEVLTPPQAVVENAAREKAGLAPRPPDTSLWPARTARAEDDVLAFRASPTRAVDGDKLYGLKLGPTERGTVEYAIANLVDGARALTLEGAALYKATLAVNGHFKVSLRASLSQHSLFADHARVEFHEGKLAIAGSDESPKERFESHVGHFSRLLVSSLLASRLKRPPTEAELATELKPLFAAQNVDVTPWLQTLARSADAADTALLAALRA